MGFGCNSREEAGLMSNAASWGGITYVTGTADLAGGERRQRLWMGTVSCRQGHHARVLASHKVGCGALAACLGEVKETWA